MTLISGIFVALASLALLLNILYFQEDESYGKYIISYLVLVLVTSAAAIGVYELGLTDNNLFVFHVFTPCEYVLLALLYRAVFQSSFTKRMIVYSIPVFLAFSIFCSIYLQPIDVNNSYSIIAESVLIVLWSLLFLRETIVLQRENRLQRFPMFWISIGFLFYFIGNLFIEGLLNHLIKQSLPLAKQVYITSFIFKYLLFLLLMMAALCRRLFKQKDDFTLL
jgi:hypothetical protein